MEAHCVTMDQKWEEINFESPGGEMERESNSEANKALLKFNYFQ